MHQISTTKTTRCLQKKERLKLIFIVGVPRSGTTWLWGLLTSHPDVIPIVREDFDPGNPSIINGKRVTSETGAFIRYDDNKIINDINRKIENFQDKTLVEKTPHHIFHIEKILRLFPQAKIIHVVRDPRAVVSSMLHSGFFKFANSVEDATNKYRDCIKAVKPFLEHNNILTIKYEDLNCNTKQCVEKVLDFTGLSKDYISKMIAENHEKSKVEVEGVYRKKENYKNELTKEDIIFIEKETGDLMQFFNF